MSGGRRSFPLAGMQAAAGQGLLVEVAEALLGQQLPGAVQVPTLRDVTAEALAAGGESRWYGMPTDAPWRTGPEDVRREAAEATETRVGPYLAGYVAEVCLGRPGDPDDPPSVEAVRAIRAVYDRCHAEVLRALPKEPARVRRAPKRHVPPRREGPCSEVVRRLPGGDLLDAHGQRLTPKQAAAILARVE